MPHPTCNCGPCLVLMPGMDKQVCRSAWASAEVLVTTANRKIGIAFHQINPYRTSGVGQIPNHQGSHLLGLLHETGHLPAQTGSIVNIGQTDHRNFLVQGIHDLLVRIRESDFCLASKLLHGFHPAFSNVDVRGEMVGLGQQDVAPLPDSPRIAQKLVEID